MAQDKLPQIMIKKLQHDLEVAQEDLKTVHDELNLPISEKIEKIDVILGKIVLTSQKLQNYVSYFTPQQPQVQSTVKPEQQYSSAVEKVAKETKQPSKVDPPKKETK